MAAGPDDLSHVHQPVMVTEVLSHLGVTPEVEGLFVDGTVGIGGHALAVLEASPRAQLLGLDRDPEALALATRRLATHADRVRLVHASYATLPEVLATEGLPAPRGILMDLGLSSLQLDQVERGFAFRHDDAPLDMRFDATSDGQTADDLVNRLGASALERLLREEGEEPRARAVARAIVRARPLHTVGELREVVRSHALHVRRIDPATRTFQALRIGVNEEMEHLKRGLRAAIEALAPGGRLVLLAFQSGEERAIKDAFREAARADQGTILTRKPLRSTGNERRQNPRSRSARLRAFERSALKDEPTA